MSNFSDLYDAIVTRVETVFPNHTRLPNPYKIEENNEAFLRQGWGLSMTSGTNSNRQLSCSISIQRSFTISLVRKFYAVESNVDNKVTVEKQLIEDQLLLIKDLCDNSSLDATNSLVDFESDDGIEYVYGDKDNFLVLNSTFRVEYFDTI